MQAFSLDGVSEQLKKAYKLFTEGKFTNALQGFNQVLWTIPMVVVDSRKEVDDVKELITICRQAYKAILRLPPLSCFAVTTPTSHTVPCPFR